MNLTRFRNEVRNHTMDTVATNAISRISARRSENNPLISFVSSPTLGDNINGPSVIRTPAWLPNAPGRYLMYFAHHGGKFIRLAYADDLHGPWQIYEPGVLPLESAPAIIMHLASPDVHVDHAEQRLRMYFHGVVPEEVSGRRWDQKTLLATSTDGLHWQAGSDFLAWSYLRVFEYGGWYYGIEVKGNLYRAQRPDTSWEMREQPLVPDCPIEDKFGAREAEIRHCAMLRRGDTLLLFYSRKKDAPERILVSTIQLSDDWNQWTASEPIDVLAPEMDYEGAAHPNEPSVKGSGTGVRQLRDPCIFEEDGHVYLFYSIAGEEGIALAEVDFELRSS